MRRLEQPRGRARVGDECPPPLLLVNHSRGAELGKRLAHGCARHLEVGADGGLRWHLLARGPPSRRYLLGEDLLQLEVEGHRGRPVDLGWREFSHSIPRRSCTDRMMLCARREDVNSGTAMFSVA